MNKAILVGSVEAPEYRTTDNGFQLLKFSVKTTDEYMNRQGEVKQRLAWHRVQAWGNLAQLRQDLQQGQAVAVEGRIQTRKYQGTDGGEKYITEIVAASIDVLNGSTPAPRPAAGSMDVTSADDFGDDDIPF